MLSSRRPLGVLVLSVALEAELLEAELLEDSALVGGRIPACGGNDALIVLLPMELDPLKSPSEE